MLKINISIKKNKKFSTASLGFFLRLPLTEHNLTYASLLAKMQMNASLNFPTVQLQQDELAQKYDLQLEIMPQLFGKELILSYIVNFVEPLEVLDPDYNYQKIAMTLAMIIQHPSFEYAIMDQAKKQLLAEYQEVMADPASYAQAQFFKTWYQDQPDYGNNFIGSIDEMKAADPQSMQEFSQALRIMPMTIVGLARDNAYLENLLKYYFKQAGLLKKFTVENLTIPVPKLMIEKNESANNLQSQLVLGFGYQRKGNYSQQTAAIVLAQYLTGDQSSRLFIKIREELGAAYAIDASSLANNSLFLINVGLVPDKAKKAKKIILNELEKIKQGEIDSTLLKKAKRALINHQLIGADQPNWQLAQLLRQQLFPAYMDFDRKEAIKKVTSAKLKQFAKNLFLNESYFLK